MQCFWYKYDWSYSRNSIKYNHSLWQEKFFKNRKWLTFYILADIIATNQIKDYNKQTNKKTTKYVILKQDSNFNFNFNFDSMDICSIDNKVLLVHIDQYMDLIQWYPKISTKMEM